MSHNSSQKFATPLRLEPKPSAILALLVWVMHLSAASIVHVLDLPIWQSVILIGAIVLSLNYSHRNYLKSDARYRPRLLVWGEDNRWQLALHVSCDEEAHFLSHPENYFEHPWLVILYFKIPGINRFRTRIPVILLPEMLPRDDFRRLRVRLRIEHTGRELDRKIFKQ